QELSAPEPHRGARLRRKRARQCARFLAQLLIRYDPADETEGEGFFGPEGASAEQELERAMTPDDLRQMHEMNCRNEAELDFRITERRACAGKEHVAGDGERHSATARCAGGCCQEFIWAHGHSNIVF